jgi:3-isopropylmalate dehydrogenase
MSAKTRFEIAVLAGDGIGPEVMEPCVDLVAAVTDLVGGYELDWVTLEAGAGHYQRTGISIPDKAFADAKKADAILLGAMGLPHIRYPDGTEIAPQLELREKLDLYAGVRPIKTFAGLPLPLASPRAAKLDAVLIRESTEGLFAARGNCQLDGDKAARDTMVITRDTSERLFEFAFKTASKRKAQGFPGKVTCVDKANVLGSFAFFRKIFDETAARYPDIEANHCYVDAAGLKLVKSPWEFDVMVTENMFGDILSDVCAGLMGGMGMAPSADIGDEHAVFQPCHGSAPDILGQGKANPIATFLSAALMLDWLGEKHANKHCSRAGHLIVSAVADSLQSGRLIPYELGGTAGTAIITEAVMMELDHYNAATII